MGGHDSAAFAPGGHAWLPASRVVLMAFGLVAWDRVPDQPTVVHSSEAAFEVCWDEMAGSRACWQVVPSALDFGGGCGGGEGRQAWLERASDGGCRFAASPQLLAWDPASLVAYFVVPSTPAQNYVHHLFAAAVQERRVRHLFDELGSALPRLWLAPGGRLLAYVIAQRAGPCRSNWTARAFDLAANLPVELPVPTTGAAPADEVRSDEILGWSSPTVLIVRSQAWRCDGDVSSEATPPAVREIAVPSAPSSGRP